MSEDEVTVLEKIGPTAADADDFRQEILSSSKKTDSAGDNSIYSRVIGGEKPYVVRPSDLPSESWFRSPEGTKSSVQEPRPADLPSDSWFNIRTETPIYQVETESVVSEIKSTTALESEAVQVSKTEAVVSEFKPSDLPSESWFNRLTEASDSWIEEKLEATEESATSEAVVASDRTPEHWFKSTSEATLIASVENAPIEVIETPLPEIEADKAVVPEHIVSETKPSDRPAETWFNIVTETPIDQFEDEPGVLESEPISAPIYESSDSPVSEPETIVPELKAADVPSEKWFSELTDTYAHRLVEGSEVSEESGTPERDDTPRSVPEAEPVSSAADRTPDYWFDGTSQETPSSTSEAEPVEVDDTSVSDPEPDILSQPEIDLSELKPSDLPVESWFSKIVETPSYQIEEESEVVESREDPEAVVASKPAPVTEPVSFASNRTSDYWFRGTFEENLTAAPDSEAAENPVGQGPEDKDIQDFGPEVTVSEVKPSDLPSESWFNKLTETPNYHEEKMSEASEAQSIPAPAPQPIIHESKPSDRPFESWFNVSLETPINAAENRLETSGFESHQTREPVSTLSELRPSDRSSESWFGILS